MKTLFGTYLKLFLYWLLVFFVGRLVFHAINYSESAAAGFSAFWGSFLAGFRLDLSMGAYFILIPLLIFCLVLLLFQLRVVKLYSGLHILLLVPALVIITIDARLFAYWGFKLDLTPFRFISTGGNEAAASIRYMDVIVVVVSFLALLAFSLWLYQVLIARSLKKVPQKRMVGAFGLLLSVILFLPIRGSVDVAPLSLSSAYFHQEHFPNQAAVNPVWNFAYALTIKDQEVPLNIAEPSDAETVYKELFSKNDSIYIIPSIKQVRPNIIIVVLESFSAKNIGPLGGPSDLTPNLNQLCREGVSFNNYYASGDRSDIGLATMFTGYPAMPKKHVLAYPQKLSKLPNLYRILKSEGYHGSFYYGGNLEFANLKSLFVTGGVDKIVSQGDLPSFDDDGKWGVHDHHLFDVFAKDLAQLDSPFIASIFSLSSHEPYKVPVDYDKFNGDLGPFNNAMYYTDSCLGALVSSLKETGLWNTSLVIVTADHATRMPDLSDVNHPGKFRIPLVLTGGVIDTPFEVENHSSQSDLAITLLDLLSIPYQKQDFPFSKNLFDTSKDFTFYFYNNGVGYRQTDGGIVYDINGNYTTLLKGSDSIKYTIRARGFTQAVHNDFLVR